MSIKYILKGNFAIFDLKTKNRPYHIDNYLSFEKIL